MNKILENLYLGDATAANHIELLRKIGITHIINITGDVPNSFPQMCQYMQIHLPDLNHSDLKSHFP